MDLVADMLLELLPSVAGGDVVATRLCPPMIRRWTRLPIVGAGGPAQLGDRLTGRLWDYPRWLRPKRGDFDVFHIVDHSYAHLIRALPAERTIGRATTPMRSRPRVKALGRGSIPYGFSPRTCSTESRAPRTWRASAKRRDRI